MGKSALKKLDILRLGFISFMYLKRILHTFDRGFLQDPVAQKFRAGGRREPRGALAP